MTDGLWLSPTQFAQFGEMADKEQLIEEIASRQAAWDWTGFLGLLPDPDPILRKLGAGSEILESLTADGHLCGIIQTRKLGTLKKEFRWEPGDHDSEAPSAAATKLRDQFVSDLEDMDLYDLISGILDAPYYGMTPIEMHWKAAKASHLAIKKLEVKPARWFGFDEENNPKFVSIANPWEGEEIPFGKFVFARHFPTYDNPYGLRLLSRCFWPVAFKKGGIKFWVTLAEKYGIPFLVGKYRQGAQLNEQQEMLSNLIKMVRDAVAVIPQGGTVEILETGKSGAGSEIHSSLKTAMDSEMSKVIMGQTLTAEVGDKGSLAAGKVHEDVLGDFRQGDQKLVKTAMENIAWHYGQINAPGVPTPNFIWFEEEEPKKETAERDKILGETGVEFKKTYYVRTYGLQEDDFDLKDQSTKPPEKTDDFAENQDDDLDDLLEDELANWQPLMQPILKPLQDLLDQAEDLDDLKTKLTTITEHQDLQALIDSLAPALLKARALGDALDD